jgi:glyceraldehyde 3-phosphate dehydrogenase
MTIRVGINGFGRMGRLALRAAWDWLDIEFVHINEIAGDAITAAHLLEFDSVHGRWPHTVAADSGPDALTIDGRQLGWSRHAAIERVPWAEMDVDVVIECTGKFKTSEALAPYFAQGSAARVDRVVVSAPVRSPGVLNVVMGVNDGLYDPARHHIVTAASCTTNCIAPVVDVMLERFGIRHAMITTIHDITNTQSVLDSFHKDLRRARAAGMSLIPTSTGSATAITEIFPQLKGRIDGIAVRVPLANASLTDCVFETETPVTPELVNAAMQEAAAGRLKGILGYEERPLVSIDYTNDTRSAIIDAASTMVVNGTQAKLLAWYDNEIGYVHRMMELVRKVGSQ